MRRERAVALAIAEARAAGHENPTVEMIAERSSLPVGWLRWTLRGS